MKKILTAVISLFVILVSISTVSAEVKVRVGIYFEKSKITVSSQVGLILTSKDSSLTADNKTCSVTAQTGGYSVNGRFLQGESLLVKPKNSSPLSINGRLYRGTAKIKKSSSGLLFVVNEVGLEDYICGIMKAEVSPDWPVESLKAQAIIARTYALRKIQRNPSAEFHVVATQHDQVYLGIAGESPKTNPIVYGTKGEVVTYGDKLITAYYHADCGGYTASSQTVWGEELPYSKVVKSSFNEGSPYSYWRKEYTLDDFKSALQKGGISVGRIFDIKVEEKDSSGRVLKLSVRHSGGTAYIKGTELRRLLGTSNLRSTLFSLKVVKYSSLKDEKEIIDKTEVKGEKEEVKVLKIKKIIFEAVILTPKPNSQIAIINGNNEIYLKTFKGLKVQGSEDSDVKNVRSYTISGLRKVDVIKKITVVKKKTFTQPKWVVRKIVTIKKLPTTFVFSGSGWGHGVGLCQWSARGMAQKGYNYRQILSFFYPGTTVKKYHY